MQVVNENEQTQEVQKTGINFIAWFFWGAYAILLAISVPHAAYIFYAYTDGSQPELWLSYAGASLIEISIYVSSFAMYKIFKKMKKLTWKGAFSIFCLTVWNVICMTLSWLLNSQHAAHFQNNAMLSHTEGVPLQNITPYLVGLWPFFGLIFTAVSRIVTEKIEEIGTVKIDHRTPEQIIQEANIQQAQLVAKANLEMTQSRINAKKRSVAVKANLTGIVGGVKDGIQHAFTGTEDDEEQVTFTPYVIPQHHKVEEVKEVQKAQEIQDSPKILELPLPDAELSQEEKRDKAVEAYTQNPQITDEEMAKLLGTTKIKGHYWILKAQMILERQGEVYNTYTQEQKLAIAIKALENNTHITKEEMAEALGTTNEFFGMSWLRKAQEEFVPREDQQELIANKVEENVSEALPLETEIYHVEEEVATVHSNGNGHVQFATAQTIEKKDPAPAATIIPKQTYYQLIQGDHVGYKNSHPYFELDGVVFASITSAYQKQHKKNVYRSDLAHEKLTYQALSQLIKEKKIAQEYVRLVSTRKPFAKSDEKDAVAVTIAIHEAAYEHLLHLIEE